MIRSLLLVFFIMLFGSVLGQQDPQFSQYMYSNMLINPGYAGSKDAIATTLMYRNQWSGWPGAPITTYATVNAPFRLFNANNGVGLNIDQDQFGVETDWGIKLSYAYIMSLNNGDGKLGIGLSLGIQSDDINYSNLSPVLDGNNATDPNLPTSSSSKTVPDMDLGIYYKTDLVYLGISTTHLNGASLNSAGSQSLTRTLYVTAGYHYQTSNPAIELQPSVFIENNQFIYNSRVDLTGMALYNKKLWFGVTYRWDAAVVFIAGIELKNGIKIGYSYDLSLNALGYNTNEIMIDYTFNIQKEKIPHKYRSVRFL